MLGSVHRAALEAGRPSVAAAVVRSSASCPGVGYRLDSKLEVSQPAVRAPVS